MPIEAFSHTDRGLVREINEDALAVLPEFGLVVLADGMGGYHAGDVASQLAVEAITAHLLRDLQSPDNSLSLTPALEAANRAILNMAATPELEGMATTAVTALFYGQQMAFAHVGDSRLYRFRDDRLQQITRDHSLVQELVDEGVFATRDEALAGGARGHVLTRGLGIDPDVVVDESNEPVLPGDVFLFCSDGLSDMVPDPVIEDVLRTQGGDPGTASERLLALALANGGLDNITAVLVRPRDGSPAIGKGAGC